MNIDRLKEDLKAWGKFWQKHEQGQGYAGTSMTEQCCKIMRTGIYSQGTSHLFNEMSDNILVPDWISEIDEAMEKLNKVDRFNLRRKYIGKKKVQQYKIDQALVNLSGII
jgi:hypothetical protein